jgi:cytochrome c oxidase cbb3-type subunit 3
VTRIDRFLSGLLALAAFAAFVSTPTLAGSQDAIVQDYTIYCAKCHGTMGHGDGPNTSSTNTRPHNFTDCATMKKMPDDTIFKAVKEGGAAVNRSNDMPPFGHAFGDGEIKQIVTHIRTFCGK